MAMPIRPDLARAPSSKRVSISLTPSQRYNGVVEKGALPRVLTPYKLGSSPVDATTPFNSLAQPFSYIKSPMSPGRRLIPVGEGMNHEGSQRMSAWSPPPMRGNTPLAHDLSARLARSISIQGHQAEREKKSKSPTSAQKCPYLAQHAVDLDDVETAFRRGSPARSVRYEPREFATHFGGTENDHHTPGPSWFGGSGKVMEKEKEN